MVWLQSLRVEESGASLVLGVPQVAEVELGLRSCALQRSRTRIPAEVGAWRVSGSRFKASQLYGPDVNPMALRAHVWVLGPETTLHGFLGYFEA